MATDDWFRNKNWSNSIEADFEARLKRSRGAFNKAQYLRIQASYLLQNPDKNIQLEGIRLMERLIQDFPTEEFSTVFGQEELGDYYFTNGDLKTAEHYFRLVTENYKRRKTKSGTSGMGDLKLARTILFSDQSEKFEEAYLICFDYPAVGLILNSDKFYYAELFAQLCDKMQKKEEAKKYAKIALDISKITNPQFTRHKNVGIVSASDLEIRSLVEIALG